MVKPSLRYSLIALLYLGSIIVTGCGSGGTLSPSPLPDASPLRGNWLVVGAMPSFGLGPKTLGLALSMDVVSGQIVGNGSLLVPCSNSVATSAAGGGTKLEATTLNNDGTFILEDVLLGPQTQHQFVLHGTMLNAAGGSWSGSYEIASIGSGCIPFSGSFTASPFQPVSGTYVATSKLAGSTQPLKISLALQQGGPVSLNVPGAIATSENVISGTIQVQGSPCFSSGTIQLNHAALFGNFINAEFTMDDGSQVSFAAGVNDLAASTLSATHLSVLGGNCDKSSGFFGVVFARQ